MPTYAITLRLADPKGENDALEEALAILDAKPLKHLRRGEQFLASTAMPKWEVLRLLNRSARGDDDFDVLELSGQTRVNFEENSKAG